MKFSWKIFIASYIVIICSFGIGGSVLIGSVFNSSLDGIIDSAVSENRLLCISLDSVLSNTEAMFSDNTLNSFTKQLPQNNKVYVGDKEQVTFYDSGHFVNELSDNEQGYKLREEQGKNYIQVISCINVNNETMYLESVIDISDTYTQRTYQYRIYRIILLCVALIGSAVIFLFSHFVTKPLKTLTNAAREISGGQYGKRVPAQKHGGSEEVEVLTDNFNLMADNVENYIEKLKDEAKRQEDFVGNFTHELKTPLTSIIGYADMLRTGELPPEDRRIAADYIYREGRRLESLSIHLLNLIVVRNNEIRIMRKSADEFFEDIKKSLRFTMEKYGIILVVNAENALLNIEPMLIKTVILNLAENACKASEKGQKVTISGYCQNGRYTVSVKDNGRGIPPDEISRVTEAFYMVDKSRARASGSAGLGLALCSKILSLHNTSLKIKSEVGKGTVMSFSLEVSCDEKGQ